MKNKKRTNTLKLVETMIQHADKGPSGFWTDDYEGCGNSAIFPEFDDGLKHGRCVHKEHEFCPWNKAILYGEGHGNIGTGCYYSCSINDARYLSKNRLTRVLKLFNERLNGGAYDDTKHIDPLLADDDIKFIKDQKKLEQEQQEKAEELERNHKKSAAKELLKRYTDNEEAKALISAHYGEDISVETVDYGLICFSPERMNGIVGGKKLTYDDYIDIQIKSHKKQRTWFKRCYLYHPLEFKGCVEKITNDRVCFKRIFVSGMYPDGTCFDGKEDHVWMSKTGFEKYNVGDCVSFFAEAYRYIKTGNGKILDYSLRNPADIKKIQDYELPSDDDLLRQEIDELICETCYLSEQCNRNLCLRPEKKVNAQMEEMFKIIKNRQKESLDK